MNKARRWGLIEPANLSSCSASVADVADVQGEEQPKRALLLTTADGHNILFIGPPGIGKTMLAKYLIDLMLPLSEPEAFEVTVISSLPGQKFDPECWRQQPFRAPHHFSKQLRADSFTLFYCSRLVGA